MLNLHHTRLFSEYCVFYRSLELLFHQLRKKESKGGQNWEQTSHLSTLQV